MVKRYKIYTNGLGQTVVRESADGKYVLYESVRSSLADTATLSKVLQEMRKYSKLDDSFVSALRVQRWADDLSALQEAHNRPQAKMPSYEEAIPCQVGSQYEKKHGDAMRRVYDYMARHFG